MGFGSKTKTTSKLASMNALYRNDNKDFGATLNQDPVLLVQQQGEATILTSIKRKLFGEGATAVAPATPFPVSKERWMGELAMDTTTESLVLLPLPHKVYTYDHAKAARLNAQVFRDRCDDLVKYTSMENDITNSAKKPNPGGQAGAHGKLPKAPNL